MSLPKSPDLISNYREPGITRIGSPRVVACAADMDNTLLATLDVEIKSIRHVLGTEYGKKFSEDVFYSRWNGRGGMFDLMSAELDLGVSGHVFKQQIRTHFNEATKSGIPYVPGAEKFLEECNARGIRVAIATSTDREGMYVKADRSDLFKHISAWASGSEVDKGKPEPDVFNLALWRLQVAPANSFGIGDTEHDIEGLEKAGVPVKVLVAGERGIVGRNTRADIVVKTPGDLDERFFNLLQRL